MNASEKQSYLKNNKKLFFEIKLIFQNLEQKNLLIKDFGFSTSPKRKKTTVSFVLPINQCNNLTNYDYEDILNTDLEYFILITDVTSLIKSERKINENKLQNIIFNKLSHEIKTPTMGITFILTELNGV